MKRVTIPVEIAALLAEEETDDLLRRMCVDMKNDERYEDLKVLAHHLKHLREEEEIMDELPIDSEELMRRVIYIQDVILEETL